MLAGFAGNPCLPSVSLSAATAGIHCFDCGAPNPSPACNLPAAAPGTAAPSAGVVESPSGAPHTAGTPGRDFFIDCALVDCLPPTSVLDGSLAHLEEPASVPSARSHCPVLALRCVFPLHVTVPMVSHAARKKKKKRRRRPAGSTSRCSSAPRAPAACCLPTFG